MTIDIEVPMYSFAVKETNSMTVRTWLNDNGFKWKDGESILNAYVTSRYLIVRPSCKTVSTSEVLLKNVFLFNTFKTTPREHSDLIIKWAKNKDLQIEFFSTWSNKWELTPQSHWFPETEYREAKQQKIAYLAKSYEADEVIWVEKNTPKQPNWYLIEGLTQND